MVVYTIVLICVMVAQTLGYKNMALVRLLAPFENGKILVVLFIFLMIIVSTGSWVYLQELKQFRQMTPYILVRIKNARWKMVMYAQKPVVKLVAIQAAVFLLSFRLFGIPARQSLIIVSTTSLSWFFWCNSAAILLWNRHSNKFVFMLILVIFGIVVYASAFFPQASFFVFYVPEETASAFVRKIGSVFVVLLLHCYRIKTFEEIGVDKND